MTIELPPLWEDLDFLSPLSPARAERLVTWLVAGLGTSASAGGEALVLDAPRVAEARRRAEERGLTDRVRFHADDASRSAPEQCAALVCVGSSQVWDPAVEQGRPLDYGPRCVRCDDDFRTEGGSSTARPSGRGPPRRRPPPPCPVATTSS